MLILFERQSNNYKLNGERYEAVSAGTKFSLNSNRQNYFVERVRSCVTSGITSEGRTGSCSRNEHNSQARLK